ncbi:MAG: PilN domain-containing protein [Pseudomonadota bacterium]
MARINLLPWRAERQKERKKQFFLMLALSAVAGFAVWFVVDGYYNAQISGQQARNAFLDQEITAVKAKITEIEALEQKKNNLLNRKKVIEELQANRSQMVHLFDSLVRTIPDGVILTGINQEGDKLTLEGRSQSYARVSAYMDNLAASGWMTKPDLSVIQAEGDNTGLPHTFSLSVTLANPNAKKEGEEGAADPAAAAGSAASQTTLQPLMPAGGTAAPAATPPAGTQPPSPPPGATAPNTTHPENAPPQTQQPPTGGAES